MVRLDLKREPHWLNLGHGVRLHVRPCTTALMMAARAEVHRIHAPVQNEAQAAGERTATLVKALARLSLLDWDGVGDADGSAAALTLRVSTRSWTCGRSPVPSRTHTSPQPCCWTEKKTAEGPRRMALRGRARILRELHRAEPPVC